MAYTARLPAPVTEEWDWQRQAACRGMDAAAFFHPPGERGPAWRRREEQAKQVCAGCPVRQECLQHSLQIEEPFGTWGGVGERERWDMVLHQRAVRRTG
ncbi:WhiB family transcriptional regulator [Pseudonocardia sp. KRD291]|uniref:WhiB family transcriptional regulator n=1 Tax=Pseudonocardia sp. KRD291 TaxID=2792007 RepID=UPI001C4A45F6|nr:WhiB family transcriptional regulator [Pseudonocardia sp. KRD291]MBW0104385.1 WhiB family transcriptional regulator [Pseudonocardia sp. KRD291]